MDPFHSSEATAKLRQPRPYPAVSLLMPTHRRAPDNAQDPVRLRNLLARARDLLHADPAVTRERRADVLDQLEQAVREVDPGRAREGLVIYAAPGEHHAWSVARAVPERVVLSDTFLTRNLVAARAAARPFWVLAVAADRVSLWDGEGEQVTEHTGDGFPLARSLEDPDAERKERIGDLPSTFRDEAARRFLRQAHEAARVVLAWSPRPLYVAGGAAALSVLEELGPPGKDTTAVRQEGLAAGPAPRVWRAVEPLRAERAAADRAAAVAELDAARGRREFAGGLDEVAHAVWDGRIRLLVVEEHFRAVVRDYLDHLEPAEPTDLDAREDLVDELVEQTLETGAEVRFVPDGTLSDTSRIACVLRY
ncbi:chemotaxis protein [Streptomyces sp. TRM66268-LWL]|uniref:Chemotaxis protein n=1 Tax=Streptomyces polyasparticus TaxID=2767826 RepID=A0ABR7SNC5_9ACTN|nr:chemotaxis protein [Streptomyces polyasparticus]MBC9716414.1 chemotaxis protein [Streptomyces polyasparticus]